MPTGPMPLSAWLINAAILAFILGSSIKMSLYLHRAISCDLLPLWWNSDGTPRKLMPKPIAIWFDPIWTLVISLVILSVSFLSPDLQFFIVSICLLMLIGGMSTQHWRGVALLQWVRLREHERESDIGA